MCFRNIDKLLKPLIVTYFYNTLVSWKENVYCLIYIGLDSSLFILLVADP